MHQVAAWAIKGSTVASFFNITSLLWLKQLQDRVPMGDTRTHQDLNKLQAALEFSADATLNAARFVSKGHRFKCEFLWLRQWQADAKHKWRLASAPFSGEQLFGASLEPLLVESRDKYKILPSLSRRAEAQPSTYFQHQSFRGSDSGFGPPRS